MRPSTDAFYNNDTITLGELIVQLQKIDPKTTVRMSCDHRAYPVKVGIERGVLHEMHADLEFMYVTELVNGNTNGGGQ